MKAAPATMRRPPARGVRTLTTRSPTRTGMWGCVPPVTINRNNTAEQLRHFCQTTHSNQMVSSAYLPWRTHYKVWKTSSSENRKTRQHFLMGKKHKNLFDRIASTDNLYRAYEKTRKGKMSSFEHLVFKEHLAVNLATLRSSFVSGSYKQNAPSKFYVYEPKRREIAALPFVDRIAQHAVNNVIEPIFEKLFLPQSYACRQGRGTHAAARDVQAELRRMHKAGAQPWVLKTDFSRYFASVDRSILHEEYKRKISCKRTLQLIVQMIPKTGVGIEIGHLMSQLSANIYGHIVDRWLVHKVGVTRFFRYMDDIVVIGHSREALDVLRLRLEQFCRIDLGLHFSRWSIQPASRGINFVGYRIWRTHKLLRRDSVVRAKRKIKMYSQRGEHDRLEKFLSAWVGHSKWADSTNLLKSLGLIA